MRTRDILLVALAALCVTYGGYNIGAAILTPKQGADFAPYYVTARLALDGKSENMYAGKEEWVKICASYGVRGATVEGEERTVIRMAYPPPAAILLSPLALLPFNKARAVFFLASVVAVTVGLYLLMSNRPSDRKGYVILGSILAAFIFFPTCDTLQMGQVNAFLILCCALALFFARKGLEGISGFFLALAIVVKIFPAALLAFFLLKRQYVAFTTALVVVALLVALSLAVFPLSLYGDYFAKTLPAKTSGGEALYRAQGFEGFFSRLLTSNDYTKAIADRPVIAKYLARGFGALGLLIAVLLTSRKAGRGTFRYEIEYGIYLAAAFLAMPTAWEHQAVFLLFLYVPLLDYLLIRKTGARAMLFFILASFCVWSFVLTRGHEYESLPHNLVGNVVMSAKFYATVILFCSAAIVLLGRRRSDVLEMVQAEVKNPPEISR